VPSITSIALEASLMGSTGTEVFLPLAPKKPFLGHPGSKTRGCNAGGYPWFVARDVCAVLEICNVSDAVDRLDKRRIVVSKNVNKREKSYLYPTSFNALGRSAHNGPFQLAPFA